MVLRQGRLGRGSSRIGGRPSCRTRWWCDAMRRDGRAGQGRKWQSTEATEPRGLPSNGVSGPGGVLGREGEVEIGQRMSEGHCKVDAR